jgi:membrane protein DedA with SNARE-associated domain
MSAFQNWLLPLLRDHGLLIVFLTMVAESACIPIPSEIVVPYGGFLAATGHTHLWAVIVVATAANIVGSGIGYGVGRYGGRALFLKYGRYVLIQKHHLDKADRWFERRGELTVFFTRMMPGVRTFISLPAGIAKMPVGKFFFYSLLGSIPWNAALAYLGYAAGKAAGGQDADWNKLQDQFGRYNHIFYIVLAVVVAALIAWGFWRWWRRRKRAAGATVETSTSAAPLAEDESREQSKNK